MPQIQFNIPNELDAKIKHYMIDKKLKQKDKAIIKILLEKLK